jgi:hypothetical protein
MPTLTRRGSGTPVTSGTTWANVTNAVDGTPGSTPATYATWTSSVSNAIGYIETSGYDFSSIPAGATINSVSVTIRTLVNNAARFVSIRFQPYSGTTPLGTAGTGADTTVPSNDTAIFPVTLAQLQAANFKVRTTFNGASSTQSRVGSIDHADVTVDYSVTIPRFENPADTAEGTDEATFVFAGPPPLVFPETFANGLPRDIDVVTVAPDPFPGQYPVTLDAAVGNPAPSLWTNGAYRGWRGKPYSRWDITGDFTYTFDMLQGGGRDIYEAMFWCTPNGADPVNGMDGFTVRLESSGDSSGFMRITNNSMTSIGPRQANLPLDTWYRVTIQAVGTVVTCTVRRISDNAVVVTNTLDLAPHLDGEHFTHGVFGQFWAASGTAQGTNIDNINVAGTLRVANYDEAVVASGALHYWKFDEPSGQAVAANSIIPEYPATWQPAGPANGTVHTQGPPIGYGLGPSTALPAVPQNEGAETHTTQIPEISGAYSYEQWVSPTHTTYPHRNLCNFFVSFTAQLNSGFEAYLPSLGGNITDRNGNGLAAYNAVLNPQVMPDSIHHFVVTVGNGAWKVYQNGVLVGSGTLDSGIGTGIPAINTPFLRFTLGEQPFAGRFSNIALYGRVLPAGEVQAHYTLGMGTPPAALTTYPADVATSSDAATTTSERVRVVADSADGTDAVTVTKATGKTVTDLATGSDSATFVFEAGQALTANPADTAVGSDSVSTLSAASRLAADSAVGTDSVTIVRTVDRVIADTAGGTDSANVLAARVRTEADHAVGSDTVTSSRIGSAVETVDDNAVGTDDVTVTATRDRTAADAAVGSDAVTALWVVNVFATADDLAVGSDDVTVLWSRVRTPADVAVGSDLAVAPSGSQKALADTAAGSDSVTLLWTRERVIADSAYGSETLAGQRTILIADTAVGTDDLVPVRTSVRSFADTAAGSDEVSLQRSGAGTTGAGDIAVGGDNLVTLAVRSRSGTDTAVGSDAVTTTRGLAPVIADIGVATDQVVMTWGHVASLADTALGSDQVSVVYDRSAVVADDAIGADDVTSELVLPVDLFVFIQDEAIGSDQVTAIFNEGEGPVDDYCWPVDYSCCPDFDSYDNATKIRSIALAGATLQMLTGYRVGGCPITVRPCRKVCDGYQPYYAGQPLAPVNWSGQWFNCTCGGDTCGCGAICQLELPRPIGSVQEVKIDGVVLDPLTYRVDDGKWLVRLGDECWPDCQDMALADTEVGTFSVTYLNAIPVDALGAYAAGTLACEYAKACNGQKCRLPSGVTSVARQGVSYEIASGAFPNGETGIREVDTWVARFNPHHLRMPTQVWTPDEPNLVRTITWP